MLRDGCYDCLLCTLDPYFLFNNYYRLPHLHHHLSMVPNSLCARIGNLVLQTGLLFLTSKQQLQSSYGNCAFMQNVDVNA